MILSTGFIGIWAALNFGSSPSPELPKWHLENSVRAEFLSSPLREIAYPSALEVRGYDGKTFLTVDKNRSVSVDWVELQKAVDALKSRGQSISDPFSDIGGLIAIAMLAARDGKTGQ